MFIYEIIQFVGIITEHSYAIVKQVHYARISVHEPTECRLLQHVICTHDRSGPNRLVTHILLYVFLSFQQLFHYIRRHGYLVDAHQPFDFLHHFYAGCHHDGVAFHLFLQGPYLSHQGNPRVRVDVLLDVFQFDVEAL